MLVCKMQSSLDYTCNLAQVFLLKPAGGVKHSDSDLVETRMLSAKKALR